MKKSMQNIFVLVCICAAVSIILAITNAITAPAIEANETAKANKALLEVMPDGKSFTKIDISEQKLPTTVTEAYRAENGGYVLKLTTTGYSSGLVIMCGVRPEGTVSGAVCLSSTETLGYEKTYGASFTDKNKDEAAQVDTISGATKTTAAYKEAIKDALNAALILSGSDVDIRTEEEILLDNLSAALPAANGEFEKCFITERLTGVDSVYQAKNQSGFVCVIADSFIGLDQNGNILSEASEETALITQTAIQTLLASESRDLTLTDYEGLPTALVSAKVTATGNYILELKGAGYGILGERHPSGEYILIRVSLTGDGTILDCLTVSQGETKGIGSVCADEAFSSRFDGKTEETYGTVDAISGATVTTNGYKLAILRAFESVKIFEKGARP